MQIPFEIPMSEDKSILRKMVQIRLDALVLFNTKFKALVSPFPVIELLEAFTYGKRLSTTIVGDKSLYRLNDFDHTEAFFAYTFYNESKCSDELILRFDSRSWLVGEGETKVAELRALFKAEGKILRHWNYSRIRAKLIFWELVTLITGDSKYLLELVEICPEYIGCSFAKMRIRKAKYSMKHLKINDPFLNDFTKAIKGDFRSKKRIYNYWQIDYFHRELSEGIKIYRKLKDKKLKEEFFKQLSDYWNLSKEIQSLIVMSPRKDSILCIDALIEKNLIPDRTAYTHTIKPFLNEIRKNILYLENCQFRLWQTMDFIYLNPDYFDLIYIWDDIKLYDFEELRNFQPEVQPFHLGF